MPEVISDLPNAARSLRHVPYCKLDKAFEKNFGSAEAMQKLGNKVVKTTLNPTTWKNGIYFWSVAGTAVLFLPILFYVLTKG